jgi:hypothetical protein
MADWDEGLLRAIADALLEDDDLIELPSGSALHAAQVALDAIKAAGYVINQQHGFDGDDR